MDVLTQARHNIASNALVHEGECVVVAVSGGPDSVCLLHVLREIAADLPLTLHVAHLNHGLRGDDADSDAAYVAALAHQWGIEATIESADVLSHRASRRTSVETAARELRYDFLMRVASVRGAQAIAVGHTADDQVETILMHWLRGAGLTGLRGMLPVQRLSGGVRLVRPLLDVTRADVEAYCAAHDLQPRLDRSNEDEHMWRNRIRHSVLPVMERYSPHLRRTTLRTARILADDDACLEELVTAIWPRLAEEDGAAVRIDKALWRGQAPAIRRRIIRRAWSLLTAGHEDLSWLHVERVSELAQRPSGGRAATMNLPRGVTVQSDGLTLTLATTAQPAARPASLPLLMTDELALSVPGCTALPDSDWSVCTQSSEIVSGVHRTAAGRLTQRFDADVVGENLHLRCRQPGDRMQPLGLEGSRKLHDIMIDEQIPRAWRSHVPLLVAGDSILWLVGSRRSDWGKITSATRRVLTVQFRCDQDTTVIIDTV